MFVSTLALFFFTATGVSGFSVTTSTPDVQVKENDGADLKCSYSADFGSNTRVEWKFEDRKGSQTYVVFDGKPTAQYTDRVTMYDNNLRISKLTRKDTGFYDCEVSGNSKYGEARVKLTVLVPPSQPVCRVPDTATTGRAVLLSCYDPDASPPPIYSWYKDGVLLPSNPSTISSFKNATYKLNTQNGNLEFPAVTKMDSGQYSCQVSNTAGPPQTCKATKMEVRDLNTGGIVAGVLVFLLLIALLAFGIWYAYKKGYLPKKQERKSKPNVVYQPTTTYGDHGNQQNGEFKQKSSFVV
ncbi:F11 receptor, tandem duplicate 1 [Mastacembelus armatus]|uniref:Junctional adhesion molecule A n=1 Tax=Mastacembelus armatus TaxID=205130 RepID=A0A3Q3ME72_9TELE|nr:junctional adhesion molecule A-like [Mastacembelus armatus]